MERIENKKENEVAGNVPARADQKNAAVIDFKMVTFSLAGKDYSIDIMHVKEIAKAGRFTYVPNTLPFVLGVYNLRGEIIPILDLRLFFNIEIPPHDSNKLENMLILQVEDQKFGVVVDKIDKVIGVQKSSIQPPHPLFGDINIKYIDGVIENDKRLYILLDITKIFTAKEEAEERQKMYIQAQNARTAKINAPSVAAVPENKTNPVMAQAVTSEGMIKSPSALAKSLAGGASDTVSKPNFVSNEEKVESGLKFLKESLPVLKRFYVTDVNKDWVKKNYSVLVSKKGDSVQLKTEAEADDFLKDFWSKCNNDWWSEDYATQVENMLPENTARQIMVWNPGCGKGMETFSLACILKKKYPNAKIRIYAQDVDLLSVSNAGLLTVPSEYADSWYAPYLTKKANGDYTFNQEIKDCIMFEYHDCKNTNALPMVDIVFARDILSLMDESSQNAVISDFLEKMKGNAIVILGDNEVMPSSFNFTEKVCGDLVSYTKD